MLFSSPTDVVNRGLQHLGVPRISSINPPDNSKNAAEAAFVYDKCRRAELRANLWNFSARRLILRSYSSTTAFFWAAPAWSSTVTYVLGSIVNFNGTNWISNVATGNLNVPPGTTAPLGTWSEFSQPPFINVWAPRTYYTGEMVYFSGNSYICLGTTTSQPPSVASWVLITPVLSVAGATYFAPQGVTTNTLTTPKPAYPLPSGYIRVMPQDPKTPTTSAQLSTAGMQFADFEFEGGFLYTNLTQGGPIVFRFAAEIQNVLLFDDLFSEMVACRVGLELCEPLTQSLQKANMLHGLYAEGLEKAERVNAIEAGSTEPSTDDVVTNRHPLLEKAPPPPRQRNQ